MCARLLLKKKPGAHQRVRDLESGNLLPLSADSESNSTLPRTLPRLGIFLGYSYDRRLDMKVLLVDDNFAIRKMMIGLLVDVADEFLECGDGAHALAFYTQGQPDWVFIDILMAGVDGLTATRDIKTRYPEARIAVVTNYDDDDLRKAAINAGAQSYVLKEDIAALRHLLSLQRA